MSEQEIITTETDETGTTIALTEKQVERKMSSELVAEVDDFVKLAKDWTDLALGLEDKFASIKSLAEKEGLTERIVKDFISSRLKGVLSYYKSQKLIKTLFKSEEQKNTGTESTDPELTTESASVESSGNDAGTEDPNLPEVRTHNEILIDFPHRLLNRLNNIVKERKEAGKTATQLKIVDGRVSNVIE